MIGCNIEKVCEAFPASISSDPPLPCQSWRSYGVCGGGVGSAPAGGGGPGGAGGGGMTPGIRFPLEYMHCR